MAATDPKESISRNIHSYLLEQNDINGVPKNYDEFDISFRDPRTAEYIHGYLKSKGNIENLQDNFDDFFYDVYPDEKKRTTAQLEAAKQKGYEEVPLEDPAQQVADIQPPTPNPSTEPTPELADKPTESVEDQMATAIETNEGALSKPKLLKSMVRQKMSDIELLLQNEEFDNIPQDYERDKDGQIKTSPRTGAALPVESDLRKKHNRLLRAQGIYKDILNMPDFDKDDSAWKNFKSGLSSIGATEIPFIGSLIDIDRSMDLVNAYRERGQEGTDQLLEAASYQAMTESDPAFEAPTGFKVGQGIIKMLPYMVEFAATGGAYTAAKGATMKGIASTTAKYGSKKAVKFLATKAGKASVRVAGEITGAMAQTFANPQAIVKNSVERMTPEYKMIMSLDDNELATMVADDGEEFGEAFSKGLGVSFSEFLTERFGQHFVQAMGTGKMLNFMKKISLSEWASRKGFKTVAETNKFFRKAGWNGVFAETYLEEYPNGLANAFITGDQPLIDALNPASEQMNTTLYTMLVMGGIGQGGRAVRGINKVSSVVKQKGAEVVANNSPSYMINGKPLTKEAARERIDAGDIGGMVINNDPESEAVLNDKAAAMRSAGEEVPAPDVNPAERQLIEDIKAEEDAQLKQQGGVVDEEVAPTEDRRAQLIDESEPGKVKRFQAGEYYGADNDGNPVQISKNQETGEWETSTQNKDGDWGVSGTNKTLVEAKETLAKPLTTGKNKKKGKSTPKKEAPKAAEKKKGKSTPAKKEPTKSPIRKFTAKNGRVDTIDVEKGTITTTDKSGEVVGTHKLGKESMISVLKSYESSKDMTEVLDKKEPATDKPTTKKEPRLTEEQKEVKRKETRIAEIETEIGIMEQAVRDGNMTLSKAAERTNKLMDEMKGLTSAMKTEPLDKQKPSGKKPKPPAKKKAKSPSTKKIAKEPSGKTSTSTTKSNKRLTDKQVDSEGKIRQEKLEADHPETISVLKKAKGLIKLASEQLRAAHKMAASMGTEKAAAVKLAYQQAHAKFKAAAEKAGLKGEEGVIINYARAVYAREHLDREQKQPETEETTGRKLRPATEKEKAAAKKKQKAQDKLRKEAEEELELEEEFENSSTEHHSVEDLENESTQKQVLTATGRAGVAPLTDTSKQIISVADIMKKMSKAAGAPIRYIKNLSRRAAGVYFPKFGSIAVRMENALGVAAHEIGHSLQDTYKLVTNAPAAAMAQIDHLSQYGSKPPKGVSEERAEFYRKGEAVAEFIREWMINPDRAAYHHKAFVEYFESVVPAKQRKALREAGDDIRRLYSASPVESMVANTTLPEKEKSAYLKWFFTDGDGKQFFKPTLWDRINVLIFNDQALFNKTIKLAMRMHGLSEKDILPEDDPRIAIALASGLHSKFDKILSNGMIDHRMTYLLDGQDKRRMTLRWLYDNFDQSSNSALVEDKEFTVGWMIAERTREILDREVKDLDEFSRSIILGYMKEHGEDANDEMTKQEAIAQLVGGKVQLKQLDKEIKAIRAKLRKKSDKSQSEIDALEIRRTEMEADREEVRDQQKVIWDGINKYHAKVVAGLGGGFYSDAAEVDRMLGEVEALKKDNPERYERLKEAKRRYREYADKTLRYAVDGGRMAEEVKAKAIIGDSFEWNDQVYERVAGGWAVDGEKLGKEESIAAEMEFNENHAELIGGYKYIKQNNNYYVAMNRIMNTTANEAWGSSMKTLEVARGLGSVENITFKLHGSAKPIIDPYESLLDNMYRTISETDNNKIRVAFVDLVIGEGAYAEDPYNVKPRGDIESGKVGKEGDLFEIGGKKPLGEVIRPIKKGDKADNRLVVFKEGIRYEFDVANADLYAAFKKLDSTSNGLGKLMQRAKKLIQLSITLSPQFAIRNFVRDIQSRYILGISTPTTDLSSGDVGHPGDGWESAMDMAGGGQFGYYDRTQKELFKVIEADMKAQLLSDISSGTVVLAKAKRGLRKYKNALAESEKFNRAAEFKARYKHGIKQGMDQYNAQLYAAFKSRGLIDFARGGVLSKQINQYIPFFNAGIQGLVAAKKAIAERPLEVMTRLMIMNMIPAFIEQGLLEGAGDDKKKDYDQLPAYRKDMFYNIPVGNTWLLFPKPFELGLLGSAAARAYREGQGDKHAWDGFAGSATHSLIPPLGGGFGMIFGGLRPIAEIMMNKDTFRGRVIIPERQVGLKLAARKRYYVRSSAVGKFIGETVTKSINAMGWQAVLDPRQVDHLIKGYTTYMGTMALGAVDAMTGGKNTQYRNTSAITGLVKDTPVWGSRDVQRVYELATRHGMFSISNDMSEMLKEYVTLPEGKTKEDYKQAIWIYAKNMREALEPLN